MDALLSVWSSLDPSVQLALSGAVVAVVTAVQGYVVALLRSKANDLASAHGALVAEVEGRAAAVPVAGETKMNRALDIHHAALGVFASGEKRARARVELSVPGASEAVDRVVRASQPPPPQKGWGE